MINKAIKKVYELMDLDAEEELVENDMAFDYLTLCRGANGRDYWWYLDEKNNIAVDAITLERLTQEQIEEQFC